MSASAAGKVLFYVQHLLGIGHLKRAATVARAIAARGLSVTLVSGGQEVAVLDKSGFDFVQLPPVRAVDRSFAALVGDDGAPIGDALKAARRDRLLDTYQSVRPDVVLIELYPFGRRQLRFELVPLIEAARAANPRPKIVSSVRDVLVEKGRPERDAEMVETVQKWFDAVLIHGDPDLLPFDKTFPLAGRIADKLNYTGYVVEEALIRAPKGTQGSGEVIVSSGGGATGEKLLRVALAARPATPLASAHWRFLAGENLPRDVFDDIRQAAARAQGGGVSVEWARDDFVTLLHNCRLSISQGGYNTVMEVLGTGAKGVVVPYAGGHETEQTVRARLLAERGLIDVIPEDELDSGRLIGAIERALDRRPPRIDIDMSGAQRTAEIVASWI